MASVAAQVQPRLNSGLTLIDCGAGSSDWPPVTWNQNASTYCTDLVLSCSLRLERQRMNDHARTSVAGGSMGEAWQNTYHAFPTSARHGLRRWQIDVSLMGHPHARCTGPHLRRGRAVNESGDCHLLSTLQAVQYICLDG